MTGVTPEGQMTLTPQPLNAVMVYKGWARAYAWPAVRKFFMTKPLGAAGGTVILLMVLTAIFADVLAPHDPFDIQQRLQFKPPSLNHWLGTDEFGRDQLTRLIYGARIAL
ncbi:MAG: hypothetical protein ACREOH_04855, partial [Candidatus Entotheonellia bacterium]